MVATTIEQPRPKTAARHSITPLLASTAFSVTGDGAFIVACPLLAASLTNDPVAISVVTVTTYLPWLLFGLVAGTLVDRWPRRRVMVIADLFRAVALVPLCLFITTGHATLLMLLITILLIGTAQCFFVAASQGIIPAIVGRNKKDLERINGQVLALDMLGIGLTGSVGGAWMFAVNRALPFVGNALSFIVSAFFVRQLPTDLPKTAPHEPVFTTIKNCLSHLGRSRQLTMVALGMAVYNLGYFIAMSTFVLYAKDKLHLGAVGFGALFAPIAVCGLIAGWQANRLIRDRPISHIHVLTLAGQGLAWLSIGVSQHAVATFILLGLTGITSNLIISASAATFQRLAPENNIGQFAAVLQMSTLTAGGIGALIGGQIADYFGLAAPVYAAAIILLLASITVWIFRRSPADKEIPTLQ